MVTLVLAFTAALGLATVWVGATLAREGARARRARSALSNDPLGAPTYPRWAVVMAWVLGVELMVVGAAAAILALSALARWGLIAFRG